MAEIDYGTIIRKNGKIIHIECGIYEDLFGDKNVGVIKLFRWGLKFVWKDKKDGFKEKQIDLRYNNRYSYQNFRKKAPAFRHGDKLRGKVIFLQFFNKKQ